MSTHAVIDATGRAKHWDKCCPMCGTWFESTREDAVTCSPRCRKRLQREGGLDEKRRAG